MESIRKQIDELCVHLNDAINAYYNENREIMSNKEFDDAMKYLENLEKVENYHPSNSPIGKVGAVQLPSTGRREVVHELRARSLDKTKDPKQIISKLSSNDDLTIAMWKLDGCTLVLTYVDGELTLAATRGDGEKGQDVTSNAKYIRGIPQYINMTSGKLIVRGECVIRYEDFEAINNDLPEGVEPYANPRNLASASVSMLNPEDMKDRHLDFQAFDVVVVDGHLPLDDTFENEDSMIDQFGYLESVGFGVVPFKILKLSQVEEVIADFTEAAPNFWYPVDGLVFALNDRSESKNLPGTEHHPDPKYGYAFKWADEEVETVLREIEWSPSRTGLCNPVAIFDPVQIAGTTVSRASLHNISYVRQKMLNIGDHITVVKSNLIIPQVIHNLSLDEVDITLRHQRLNGLIPAKCPTCGELTEIRRDGISEMLYCTNPNCPEKLIGKLAHFCSRDGMDIDGWSEQTIKKLIDAHFVAEFKDIFTLESKPAVSFMPGFGKKSWEKLYSAAKEASHTSFVKFVSALSITNVGKGQAKILKRYIDENYKILNQRYHIDGYHPFILLVEMACHDFDFTVIDGIGIVMSENITRWFKENYGEGQGDTPYKRLAMYVDFTDKEPLGSDFMNPPSGVLASKSFCITGKLVHHANRQELVDKIEANGGKWVDSVSSRTDYLINNDTTSMSGKNKKAKELNIPIISEDEFLSLLV